VAKFCDVDACKPQIQTLPEPVVSSALTSMPSGTYKGNKDELGHEINAVMIFDDAAGTMQFQLSGVLTLDCKNEPFTLSGDHIMLTNLADSEDCITKALSGNDAELKEIEVYSGDELHVYVHYHFLDVDVHLYKQSSDEEKHFIDWDAVKATQMDTQLSLPAPEPLADLGDDFHGYNTDAHPWGFYTGYTDFHGRKVWANMTVSDKMEINVWGKMKIFCNGDRSEAYSLVMAKPPYKQIYMTNWGDVMDCMTEYMRLDKAELVSMYYDTQNNQIGMTVQVEGYNISITMKPTNEDDDLFMILQDSVDGLPSSSSSSSDSMEPPAASSSSSDDEAEETETEHHLDTYKTSAAGLFMSPIDNMVASLFHAE